MKYAEANVIVSLQNGLNRNKYKGVICLVLISKAFTQIVIHFFTKADGSFSRSRKEFNRPFESFASLFIEIFKGPMDLSGLFRKRLGQNYSYVLVKAHFAGDSKLNGSQRQIIQETPNKVSVFENVKISMVYLQPLYSFVILQCWF